MDNSFKNRQQTKGKQNKTKQNKKQKTKNKNKNKKQKKQKANTWANQIWNYTISYMQN